MVCGEAFASCARYASNRSINSTDASSAAATRHLVRVPHARAAARVVLFVRAAHMVSIALAMSQRNESTIEPVTMRSRRGARLAGLLHLPAGRESPAGCPTVVLCHGMESTKEGTKHQALAARLTALGYVCLRFDFSYVGESEGRFEDLTIRDRKSV